MGWLSRLPRLFGQKEPQLELEVVVVKEPKPHTAKTPKIADKQRRKRRTPEEITADNERFAKQMRKGFRKATQEVREKALYIGSTEYIWRTALDSDVCPTRAKNEGKRFSWNSPPPNGHPGGGECRTNGYCRCYPESVIPDEV